MAVTAPGQIHDVGSKDSVSLKSTPNRCMTLMGEMVTPPSVIERRCSRRRFLLGVLCQNIISVFLGLSARQLAIIQSLIAVKHALARVPNWSTSEGKQDEHVHRLHRSVNQDYMI